MRVAAVIPVRDEQEGLPLVLQALPRRLLEEIIVVDNGSTDGSADAARAGGATLLQESRRGYGRACRTAVEYLRIKRPDIVVFLDGDFSDDPADLPRLLGPLERGECDLVIGSRVLGRREPGALLLHARAGNWLVTRLLRLLYGARFTDLGPFRAVRFESLLLLEMADGGCGWTAEMQAKAVLRGLGVLEVPVSYRRRVGRSKISGTVSGTIRAGAKILWTVARLRLQAGRGFKRCVAGSGRGSA